MGGGCKGTYCLVCECMCALTASDLLTRAVYLDPQTLQAVFAGLLGVCFSLVLTYIIYMFPLHTFIL